MRRSAIRLGVYAALVTACACSSTVRSVPAPEAAPVTAGAATGCALDFDSTYAIVSRDYAGYQDRLRENATRVMSVADSVRMEVRTVATDSACTATIQRWTAIFREHDHHLQFWQERPSITPAARPGALAEDTRRPALRFHDDSTAVMTLPTFDRRYKPAIDSLVDANRDRLFSTPYLVVDVRRNPGGADASFTSVMALLYTTPIPREGFDVWVSAGTIAGARPMLADPRVDSAAKAEIRDAIMRFEQTGRAFFVEGKGSEVRFDTVRALPRAVAVLTGRGCASSCEQFVLDASYSRKVTVMGTTNTAGFLDYGNVRFVTLPAGIRRLGVPGTRSRRLPGRPLDNTGLTPDVLIPNGEQDAIGFAIRFLKGAPRQDL